jgi:D-alanyl-D-alanine carboxypeptidase (penicillin-binding protein 5/6)
MSVLRSLFCSVILAGSGLILPAKVQHSTPVEGVYAGAIVMEAGTGQVLIEESADVANPPASMTKLMTFAVVHDKLADGTLTLQTPVQVDASDARMGGTQVYLDPRETFPVEELIYAMMIQSANDASHALARAAAGSTAAFVDLMNAKARALGMTHTTFRTPHGLPPPSRRLEDGDLSTPRDFAVLCRYLLQNTDVLKYTSVRDRAFAPQRAKGPLQMRNHNNLLGKIAGVDGLKTGYTQSAGYCLSATAERNGRRIIAVIMGSFGPGKTIDKGRARDLKAIELIDRGFAAAPAAPVVIKTVPDPAPASARVPAKPAEVPTVKTDKTAPAPAEQQASTPGEPMFKFRVIPPEKKP